MLERFADVDLSKGAPMRELIGCLTWCTQNLHGPELIRVKSHGPRLNDFTTDDYDDAVATMHAVAKRTDIGLCADMVELRKRSFLHPPDPEKLSMFLHLLDPHTPAITKWWMSSKNVICTLGTTALTISISVLALSTRATPSRSTSIPLLLWIPKCAR
jgi:hypothetical protein